MTPIDQLVERFERAERHRFDAWPDESLSKGRPGVYGIWAGDELLFVGLSWQDRADTDNPQAQGVWGRLQTYMIRNQPSRFISAVFDRFVFPSLEGDSRTAIADDPALASEAAHQHLRNHFEYRALVTSNGEEARALADAIKGGHSVFGPPTY
jgi:hypothetical protein